MGRAKGKRLFTGKLKDSARRTGADLVGIAPLRPGPVFAGTLCDRCNALVQISVPLARSVPRRRTVSPPVADRTGMPFTLAGDAAGGGD